MTPRAVPLPEFSLRVATRPARGDWFVLATPPQQLADTQEALAINVAAFAQATPRVTATVGNARDLVRAIRPYKNEIILVAGFEGFSEIDWRSIDLVRSQLEGPRTVVLLMSPKQLNTLAESAPNLTSWITGGIWQLSDDIEQLSDAERSDRLVTLRTSTGLTDDEVVQRAQDGTLSREPHFTEWLILLRRSELIERR